MQDNRDKLMYECSIEGFINDFKVAEFGNPIDTINNALAYILKYNMHLDYTKCDIKELIFTAKNEVAKTIAKRQIYNNSKNLFNMQAGKDNEEVEKFLTNPVKYIGEKFKDADYVDMIHYENPNFNPEEKKRYDEDVWTSARHISQMVEFDNLEAQYKEYEKHIEKNQAFTSLLCAKLAVNDSTISASFNKQKAGFFEKLFNTTSEEYENFKAAYNNYNNENHSLYGDDTALKDAAMGYLRHKFPNLKGDNLPTEEQIKSLGGAGKERASFCLAVVNTYNENHKLQEHANKMLEEIEPYAKFKRAYENYLDEKNPLYGNEKVLADTAMEYINFKFPELDKDEIPNEELLDKFNPYVKEKVATCLKIVNTYEDLPEQVLPKNPNEKIELRLNIVNIYGDNAIEQSESNHLFNYLNNLEKDVDLDSSIISNDNNILDDSIEEELNNSK